jgi:hypothetical protein
LTVLEHLGEELSRREGNIYPFDLFDPERRGSDRAVHMEMTLSDRIEAKEIELSTFY